VVTAVDRAALGDDRVEISACKTGAGSARPVISMTARVK
jgi:hypothetical protein